MRCGRSGSGRGNANRRPIVGDRHLMGWTLCIGKRVSLEALLNLVQSFAQAKTAGGRLMKSPTSVRAGRTASSEADMIIDLGCRVGDDQRGRTVSEKTWLGSKRRPNQLITNFLLANDNPAATRDPVDAQVRQ